MNSKIAGGVLIFALSVTSINLKINKDGVELELQRTQQALVEAQKQQEEPFALSGLCDK